MSLVTVQPLSLVSSSVKVTSIQIREVGLPTYQLSRSRYVTIAVLQCDRSLKQVRFARHIIINIFDNVTSDPVQACVHRHTCCSCCHLQWHPHESGSLQLHNFEVLKVAFPNHALCGRNASELESISVRAGRGLNNNIAFTRPRGQCQPQNQARRHCASWLSISSITLPETLRRCSSTKSLPVESNSSSPPRVTMMVC